MTHLLMHRGHHSGLVQVVGVIAIVTAVLLGPTEWLWATLFTYVVVGLSVSAGFHFKFTHNSYRTYRWVERVMLYLGTLSCSGSSLQWCAAHTAHHMYSDTDQDPHNVKSWKSAWLINYHYPKYSWKCARQLMKHDPWHMWFHRHYWLVNMLTLLALTLINWELGFYGYVLPVGMLLIMGGIHNIVAHWGRQPRDVWWMIPVSVGEWRHKFHHDHPSRWDMGPFNPSSLFIRLIRKK